jgi:C4-dicarboxylate-specific signal transduction histidine kinase
MDTWMDPSVYKELEGDRMLAALQEMEGQLRQLQDAISRSHRLSTLGTMASMIAHEFNNILTPVISYCQMAQQSPGDLELQRKAVDRALAGSIRAAKITTSMLGFAHEVEDDDRAASLRQVIDEVFSCLGREPDKDGIELTIDVPADLRVAMSGSKLQQVLLNLVLNARQAMKGRRGRLTIRAERRGGQVSVTVADSGGGIPAEIRDQLFEPFVTCRTTSRQNEERGTGLGLTICRELVGKAGGVIDVASTGPTGTTFRIELSAAE